MRGAAVAGPPSRIGRSRRACIVAVAALVLVSLSGCGLSSLGLTRAAANQFNDLSAQRPCLNEQMGETVDEMNEAEVVCDALG